MAVAIWNAHTGNPLHTAVAFAPESKALTTGGSSQIKLCDLTTPEKPSPIVPKNHSTEREK